ncbi:MAG: RagB/SusD family nutrient uptake outer membrane protein, partial [Bacteroidales bacterium]|nr:RagB/SusD family nutrient uptake outer membrane protein [Bacteroidales bacterium]
GVGDGWGGGNGGSPDLQAMYDANDLRRKPTLMYKDDFYAELLKADGGYTYDKESSAGSAIKKYVIGTPDDNGGEVAFMKTPLNTYMMRLAEVYLIYAEATMGTANQTTDADALNYFNMIRNRAGLADDADGTLTWRDVFDEKRMELAMEFQHWYDVVRWSYFDQAGALNYLRTQERGDFHWENGVKVVNSRFYDVQAEQLSYPYPEADVTANPKLKEDPVDYPFN